MGGVPSKSECGLINQGLINPGHRHARPLFRTPPVSPSLNSSAARCWPSSQPYRQPKSNMRKVSTAGKKQKRTHRENKQLCIYIYVCVHIKLHYSPTKKKKKKKKTETRAARGVGKNLPPPHSPPSIPPRFSRTKARHVVGQAQQDAARQLPREALGEGGRAGGDGGQEALRSHRAPHRKMAPAFIHPPTHPTRPPGPAKGTLVASRPYSSQTSPWDLGIGPCLGALAKHRISKPIWCMVVVSVGTIANKGNAGPGSIRRGAGGERWWTLQRGHLHVLGLWMRNSG